MRQKLKEPALQAAESYVSEEKGVASGQEALDGAKDILAELVSDEAKYRTKSGTDSTEGEDCLQRQG